MIRDFKLGPPVDLADLRRQSMRAILFSFSTGHSRPVMFRFGVVPLKSARGFEETLIRSCHVVQGHGQDRTPWRLQEE